jgi:hypothetical protein
VPTSATLPDLSGMPAPSLGIAGRVTLPDPTLPAPSLAFAYGLPARQLQPGPSKPTGRSPGLEPVPGSIVKGGTSVEEEGGGGPQRGGERARPKFYIRCFEDRRPKFPFCRFINWKKSQPFRPEEVPGPPPWAGSTRPPPPQLRQRYTK